MTSLTILDRNTITITTTTTTRNSSSSNSSSSNQKISPIRMMDMTMFTSIVSRAKYQIRMLNEGTSRGDAHRKHIFERFHHLSSLDFEDGDFIKCDRCNKNIEMFSTFFLHKRRSYNRFFHLDCARMLNLL